MHNAVLNSYKEGEDYSEYDKVEEELKREASELQTISDTLFTKTSFGLTLQEMYASSAKIGKRSVDYTLYKQMVKNSELMAMDYKTLYSNLRLIEEKNKAEMYHRYIELKKNNPLIDHIKPKVEIHVINQMKTKIREMLNKNIIPFDSGNHAHARQLMVYSIVNDVQEGKGLKPLVKMLSRLDNPKLYRTFDISKVAFFLYPYYKKKTKEKEEEILKQFEGTLKDINSYLSGYDLLNKVLDRHGYLITVDNIINGNSIYLKLLLNALDDYVEIRDVNMSLQGLTEEERVLLDFAYKNSKTTRQFKEVLDKILGIRAVSYTHLTLPTT